MSFLVPAFLFGCLAAGVPIVLHLFRRERFQRVRFSDVRFLLGAQAQQMRHLRLYELLLLALRVGAVLLLAFAFAHPFFDPDDQLDGPATVVLVDTSFSVSGPGQQDEVQALARAAVNAAPDGHLVGVVAFDDEARVVAGLTGSRSSALAAVDSLSARPRATRYSEGLTAASDLIGDRSGRLILVSDLQAAGWATGGGSVPPRVELELRPVRPPASNLAVVGLDIDSNSARVVLLQVGSVGPDTTVSLALDGAVVDTRSVTPVTGRSTVTFPVKFPASGVVMASVVDPSGYSVDDRRYRLLDQSQQATLLIVVGDVESSEAFYLQRALAPGSYTDPFAVSVVSASALGTDLDILEEVGAVVLLGTFGLNRRGQGLLASFVQNGGGLFVAAGPAFDGDLVQGFLSRGTELGFGMSQVHVNPVTLVVSESRHPIIRRLGGLTSKLSEARFTRTLTTDPGVGIVIARFSDQAPALVEYEVGEGRILFFASDLETKWNDWPRQRSFVPFLHEVLSYLSDHRVIQQEFVANNAPAGLPDAPGVFALVDGPGRVVVNVDSGESDPTPLSQDQFIASVGRLAQVGENEVEITAVEQEGQQQVWRYLLLLVAVFLTAEGWLGRLVA